MEAAPLEVHMEKAHVEVHMKKVRNICSSVLRGMLEEDGGDPPRGRRE